MPAPAVLRVARFHLLPNGQKLLLPPPHAGAAAQRPPPARQPGPVARPPALTGPRGRQSSAPRPAPGPRPGVRPLQPGALQPGQFAAWRDRSLGNLQPVVPGPLPPRASGAPRPPGPISAPGPPGASGAPEASGAPWAACPQAATRACPQAAPGRSRSPRPSEPSAKATSALHFVPLDENADVLVQDRDRSRPAEPFAAAQGAVQPIPPPRRRVQGAVQEAQQQQDTQREPQISDERTSAGPAGGPAGPRADEQISDDRTLPDYDSQKDPEK